MFLPAPVRRLVGPACSLVLVGLICLLAPGCGPGSASPPDPAAGAPRRIVSLAPSITEMLFDLDLGDRVVGVTSFCDYPPEAAERPHVGGLLDPNPEAIMALEPDLVVLFDHHTAARRALETLGIPLLVVQGDTLEQILGAMESLAERCGCGARGQERVGALRRRIEAIAARPAPQPAPRVLVSIGRTLGGGRLKEVYVAGDDGFFSELIRLAGGRNACPSSTIRFPLVSPEGILEMRPEVIIELAADLERLGIEAEDVRREWSSLGDVPAVVNGRVHVFTEDYVTVPGPRLVLLLEQMAAAIRQGAVAAPAAPGPGGAP